MPSLSHSTRGRATPAVMSLRGTLHTLLLAVTACPVALSTHYPVYYDYDTPEGETTWMLMPDGPGDVRLAIVSQYPNPYSSTRNMTQISSEDIEFILFTRDNPKIGERGKLNSTCSSLQFSKFSPKRRTKVLVHGFGDAIKDSLMVPLVRDAFLARGDFNIFAVDWAPLAQTPWYNTAANNTYFAAEMTARLIDDLEAKTGASTNDFHLIGFSLGAHVVGITGRLLAERRPGDDKAKVRRITGLDPAQVLFTTTEANKRLDSSHASFVEVVHTSGGYLGFMRPLGHVDVYPNGGAWPQPGCVLDFVAVCSHRRAYYLYSEAILSDGKGFEAKPCISWNELEMGNCKGNGYPLGMDAVNESARGLFLLETNEEEPFAKESNEVPKDRYFWW